MTKPEIKIDIEISIMRTTLAKEETIERKWFIVDAAGKTLGRLAVAVANIIRGRHKATYTPSADTGDFVVVINVEKIHVTGDKENQKDYKFHSGYIGNQKCVKLSEFRQRKPDMILSLAVKGMMPNNNLARHMMKKLRIYRGTEHPHQAQNPIPLNLES